MKFTEIKSPVPGARAFFSESHCSVLVATEPTGPEGEMRWHMSIAHGKRYPHWDEIRNARYMFVPDEVTMVMILPPGGEYVNVHERCFHLFQMEEAEIAKSKIIVP